MKSMRINGFCCSEWFFTEPTHELLGVGVKGFSGELGSRKRGVGLSSWCDIVAEAVRGGPRGAPFTLPEVASRVWSVGFRVMGRLSAVGQRQVHRQQRFVQPSLE